MKDILLIILLLIFNLNSVLAQTKSEIDSLLNGIVGIDDSKRIVENEQAKKIIDFGDKALPILVDFFTDSTLTKINSECQERKLTKGEVAIIIADRIELMPYFKITGVENCLMTFCVDNQNFIEYYIWKISQDGFEKFQKKYLEWLCSKDRLDWPSKLKGKARRERKKVINELKLKYASR